MSSFSFMCQAQLSWVKFMFHFDSAQTKFLDQRQTRRWSTYRSLKEAFYNVQAGKDKHWKAFLFYNVECWAGCNRMSHFEPRIISKFETEMFFFFQIFKLLVPCVKFLLCQVQLSCVKFNFHVSSSTFIGIGLNIFDEKQTDRLSQILCNQKFTSFSKLDAS